MIDKSLTDVKVMYVAIITELVLDERVTGLESGTGSESEELYNIEEIISHKLIKEVRFYRIK